jgi:hypothetical protein
MRRARAGSGCMRAGHRREDADRTAHPCRRAGGQVEQDRPGGGKVSQGTDGGARFDGAAEFDETGGERMGDGLRAPAGEGPAVTVRSGGEHESDGGAARAGERAQRMSGDPREQGTSRLPVPSAQGPLRGAGSQQSEPARQDGVTRQPRQRAHEVFAQGVVVRGQGCEQPTPCRAVGAEPPHGRGQIALEHGRLTAVEGVGEVGPGVLPAQSVPFQAESAQVGRCDGHGMHRGAVVVEQAGHGDLATADAAADGGGGFGRHTSAAFGCPA